MKSADEKRSKEKERPRKNRKTRKVTKSLQIVRIAAFCFAIISWIATANGLSEYVFHREGVQAYTLSFAIQAILFVFNLKLPAHFAAIKQLRQRFFIAVLYCTILVSSSFFSYVYIANMVYEDTRYNDANVTLNREYREKLDDTRRYAEEYANLGRIVVSRKLLNLDGMLGAKNPSEISANAATKEALERAVRSAEIELETAKQKYNLARESVESAEKAVNAAKEAADTANAAYARTSASLRDNPISTNARINNTNASNRVSQASNNLTVAQDALEKKQTARTNALEEVEEKELKLDEAKEKLEKYNRSFNANTHDMLVEILKQSPSSAALRNHLNAIHATVIDLLGTEDSISNFTEIVGRTQELTTAVERYLLLRSVLSDTEDGAENVPEDSGVVTIDSLQEQLLRETVTLPNVKANAEEYVRQQEEWETLWQSRFMALQRIVQRLPRYADASFEDVNGVGNANQENAQDNGAEDASRWDISDVINFASLREYDAKTLAKEIDNLMRAHLSEINVMERACNLLLSSYPFLAWFSLAIALFLDISSLLAGLFIYFASASKEKGREKRSEKQEEELLSDNQSQSVDERAYGSESQEEDIGLGYIDQRVPVGAEPA